MIDHRRSRAAHDVLKGRARSQGLGDQLVVIAAVGEVEAEQQIQGLAVQRADRQHVGSNFQHQAVQLQGVFGRRGIDLARTDAAVFQGHPAVATQALVFLQDKIAFFAAVKVSHRGISLLQPLEKMQYRFTVRREIHLGAQRDVHIKIVAQITVLTHRIISSRQTQLRSNEHQRQK